jgi:HNH endonuclease
MAINVSRQICGTRMPTKLIVLCGEQGWRCAYCGVRFVMSPRSHEHAASFDEVVPRSLGGAVNWDNQVAACNGCNAAKKSTDAEEFFELVQRREAIGAIRAERAAEAATRPDGKVHDAPRSWRNYSPGTPLSEKLKRLKASAEVVPMSESRARYFERVYGFVPS